MILTVRKPLPEDHLRRAVRLVAVLNLAYFFVEFVVALAIGSVSLFADSIDFLEDTSVKLPYPRFSRLVGPMAGTCGKALSILLATVIATLCTAWHTFLSPVPAGTIAAIADGRRGVRHQFYVRPCPGSLPPSQRQLDQGRLLSARNDALANLAISAASLLTAYTLSVWPDLIVGLGIVAINADAARKGLGGRKQRAY